MTLLAVNSHPMPAPMMQCEGCCEGRTCRQRYVVQIGSGPTQYLACPLSVRSNARTRCRAYGICYNEIAGPPSAAGSRTRQSEHHHRCSLFLFLSRLFRHAHFHCYQVPHIPTRLDRILSRRVSIGSKLYFETGGSFLWAGSDSLLTCLVGPGACPVPKPRLYQSLVLSLLFLLHPFN